MAQDNESVITATQRRYDSNPLIDSSSIPDLDMFENLAGTGSWNFEDHCFDGGSFWDGNLFTADIVNEDSSLSATSSSISFTRPPELPTHSQTHFSIQTLDSGPSESDLSMTKFEALGATVEFTTEGLVQQDQSLGKNEYPKGEQPFNDLRSAIIAPLRHKQVIANCNSTL